MEGGTAPAQRRTEGPTAPAQALRTRLLRVMAARLGICVGALALALTLVGAGRLTTETAELGLYGTLGIAFFATAVYSGLLPFVRAVRRFAGIQLVTDLALVTALVTFSGGAESIFSFLYLPVVVFGGLLFDRPGGYGTAGGASAGFAVGILMAMGLPAGGLGAAPAEFAFTLWGVHTGAMLVVALFATGLTRELRRVGEQLEASTSDLAELRSLHQRIVESLTSGVLTTDPAGRVTSFNPEAAHITGRRAEDALGARIEDVLPGIEEIAASSLSGRRRARFRFERSDGEERYLGVALSNLQHGEAGAGGWVVIFQDVTEVVRLEGALEHRARLAGIGELSASIAHEIRNPLAAISGSVEMLRATLPREQADGEGGRLMGIVLREIDRLNHLITDFLQYARPAPPKKERVDLGRLTRQVAETFGAGLGEDVRLDLSLAPGCFVNADSKQLQQLLWNLLGNARDALAGPGRLGLRVALVGAPPGPQDRPAARRNEGLEGARVVELVVSDNGVGISPRVQERIFDPFFTTREEGTGLGLAIVHRIAQHHEGAVQVASREGAGTEFRVTFPAGEPPA